MQSKAATIGLALFSCLLWAQDQKSATGPSANTSASAHDMPDMPGMEGDGSAQAMHSMEGRSMDMGPHMKMTALRQSQPGDSARAAQVVDAARKVAEKYTDYRTALADGFQIFLPNVPQKQYHFTNYRYAFEASLHFNPGHPTSLLYEKQGNNYKLIGLMYTAPKYFSEDQLNERIPLSIAQWHAHVNLCLPPQGSRAELLSPNPQFGLAGSISTQEAGSFRRFSAGWFTSIPSSRSRKTSGRLSGRCTSTWTEI